MADLDPADELPGPLRIYALAIRQAETDYRKAVTEARRIWQATIDEALAACDLAMGRDRG